MVFEKSAANAVWIIFYQAPGGEEVLTERTTDPGGTIARLQAAGYVVIDDILE